MKWREVLEKVERGELTAEEGAALMGGGERVAPDGPASAVGEPPKEEMPAPEPDPELEERLAYWKRWWMVPLWVGMGIFLIGAALIAWGHTSEHIFWFVCGFFPLLLGLLGMFLAWWSQTARWLHVRVRDHKEGKVNRVTISLPVPIHLAGWFLRVFGGMIPGLREQETVREVLPSMLSALEKEREPLSVEVNDKDGSEVQVYFT